MKASCTLMQKDSENDCSLFTFGLYTYNKYADLPAAFIESEADCVTTVDLAALLHGQPFSTDTQPIHR